MPSSSVRVKAPICKFSNTVRRPKILRPSGTWDDTPLDDFVSALLGDFLASESDHPALRWRDAGDGIEGGRLAGAVAANEGDDFALVDLQGDALHGQDLAIGSMDIVDVQQGAAFWFSSLGMFGLFAIFRRDTQVGFDDARVPLHFTRAALGDLRAVIQHGDLLRYPMTSFISCSMSKTETCRSSGKRRIKDIISSVSWGFMPAAGSSSISSSGWEARARAISKRLWEP